MIAAGFVVGALVFGGVIALLLNASALEVTMRQDIDMNRELITAGLANLAGGLTSSPIG